MKRPRDEEIDRSRPISKRPKIDADLARLWENLADDNEETRLEAAFELIQTHCRDTQPEYARNIARRLFRGLCSGRKGARPGFYIALVGALSLKPNAFGCEDLSFAETFPILELQTRPEAGTSGQDERDHYFGRLLAVKAVVESGVLESSPDLQAEWARVLDSIYTLMVQKPWLRAEASAVVCSAIHRFAAQKVSDAQKAAVQTLKQLNKHKLTRTIGGVAIWLTVKTTFPSAKLPQDSWNLGNPLSLSELSALKKALLDSRTTDNLDQDVTGTSGWSPSLNPAWKLVLQELSKPRSKNEVSFERFWNEVVDNGVFGESSNPERKLTGFLILETALQQVDDSSTEVCFSRNLMASLMQGLSAKESYQRRIIDRITAFIKTDLKHKRPDAVHQIIRGLLVGSDLRDFDVETKTDILQSLLTSTSLESGVGIGHDLLSWLHQLPIDQQDVVKANSRKRNLINILQRAVCQQIRCVTQSTSANALTVGLDLQKSFSIIKGLMETCQKAKGTASTISLDEPTFTLLTDKMNLCLEALLTAGAVGQRALLELVRILENFNLEAEAGIQESLSAAWQQYNKLVTVVNQNSSHVSINGHAKRTKIRPGDGLAMLFAMVLYQVYNGDEGSIEMLDEVVEMVEDFLAEDKDSAIANHIVDIVLSLFSKSSKLIRRAASLIFEAFAVDMSSDGLKALRDILTAKESREGQQELFESGDIDTVNDSDANSLAESDAVDSDVEIVDGVDDSDVEVDDKASDSEETPSESGDDTSEPDDAETDSNDEELDNFESALAAALGTRKLDQNDLPNGDEEDDSDSDMSDSEMMQLDDKLAEVFKNQQNQSSAQKLRKAENKNAKENVINLKNRALDMVEIFLRTQQARGLECLELLSSVLELAATTNTQQLANRAVELIKTYSQKSRGPKLPQVEHSEEAQTKLQDQLRRLHVAICNRSVSNAFIDAAAQLNTLICRLLVKTGKDDVEGVVTQISSETGSKRETTRRAFKDFWSRYNAWTNSLRDNQQKQPAKVAANGDVNRRAEEQGPSVPAKPKDKKKKQKKSQQKDQALG
ncbi:DNA-directed DNA polymerase [Lithohypha guttulata]|uniref:DNA-directed DNA polymerase n=1 Tax=Lithohypha guttulata TaxID=1690604 RepID=UPI002DE1D233|nr:DNA-directed DNA polymerase [Lithohypha guttulata]